MLSEVQELLINEFMIFNKYQSKKTPLLQAHLQKDGLNMHNQQFYEE